MDKTQKEIPFRISILPIIVMAVLMGVTIIGFEGSPHVPLIIGSVCAGLIAWKYGYSFEEIENGIYDGIRLALPAVLILMTVGMIISTWIGGGVVATMIYYGLKMISPSLFLMSIFLLCSIVSLAIGSSWSTMGTIGVAGMGIGMSMGLPAPMIAGAIISGSYFGDKMSPFSDTTTLAAGVTETDLFEHIKHMAFTTIPGFIIALLVYLFFGFQYQLTGANTEEIQLIMAILEGQFTISPWLLLIPAAVIFLVIQKVPTLPALLIGVLLGWICQITVQGGDLAGSIHAIYDGFSIETGNAFVDELFNRGGIGNMMYTISLVIVAMTFAGVLEATGMLRSIVNQILKVAKSAKSLIPATIFTSFLTNVVAAEQYVSLLLPGRMFNDAYKEKNLHSKNLSRALEDGGTLTSPFVPWNTCGVYITATLMVSPWEYAPYAVLNYVVPLIGILFGIIGFKVEALKKPQTTSSLVQTK